MRTLASLAGIPEDHCLDIRPASVDLGYVYRDEPEDDAPDASDEEFHHVLHTAMADFVFELPEGIDSECGERGGGLSEGQAQRIAIARGLLRPGSILLLDEISASLDERTERELYRRLFEAYPQKTMIFITHRQLVCELCDDKIILC